MRGPWPRLVLATLLALPAIPAQAAPLDHLPVLAGDYFAIESRETGHRYHIYIRYPEDYAKHPQEHYPVVYVLDGDSLFPLLGALHLFLAYDDDLAEALVVGIAYGSFAPPQNRRGQDFTNGAPAFDRFLERELIPTVEGKVRAKPDRRILFGQSRGGGYVLHSAFTNPDLFWGRIDARPASRPSPVADRRKAHRPALVGDQRREGSAAISRADGAMVRTNERLPRTAVDAAHRDNRRGHPCSRRGASVQTGHALAVQRAGRTAK